MSKPLLFAMMLFCFIPVGCANDTKHQVEFRGTWDLESRSLPQGQEIKTPKVYGLIEWFPLTQDKAHVLISQTDQRDAIQILDGVFTRQNNTFALEVYVQIGGKLGNAIGQTYETKLPIQKGTIVSDDARTTLIYEDGTRFEFIGVKLTVTYPNGTTDHWKRQKDQKGALIN